MTWTRLELRWAAMIAALFVVAVALMLAVYWTHRDHNGCELAKVKAQQASALGRPVVAIPDRCYR